MKKWRFKIGDKVTLRKEFRVRKVSGTVIDRCLDNGTEMIWVDCVEPGWWQADWWMPVKKRVAKAVRP